ncbi:hypothetical protein M758_9G031300 [Ceratodon purpureus]|uniref:Uncharacterized protein n=1 Tax=Ceratodon purpureus TaxID=3225 RepID=A0A8T0GN70_CERPU|nr:hypothetical protein KC19_9G029400 [Ceratodon purpureus]KAG0605100.1 hypothetical protein M758_9G031300 [Ceratodon purpureus]
MISITLHPPPLHPPLHTLPPSTTCRWIHLPSCSPPLPPGLNRLHHWTTDLRNSETAELRSLHELRHLMSTGKNLDIQDDVDDAVAGSRDVKLRQQVGVAAGVGSE